VSEAELQRRLGRRWANGDTVEDLTSTIVAKIMNGSGAAVVAMEDVRKP